MNNEAFMEGYMSNKEAGLVGDLVWEGSKFIPLVGALPSGIDAVKALGKGNLGRAGLETLGAGLAFIPGMGQIGKGGLASMKMLANSPRLLGAAGKLDKGIGAVRSTAPMKGLTRAADRVGTAGGNLVGKVSPRLGNWIKRDPRMAGTNLLWTGKELADVGESYRDQRAADNQLFKDMVSTYGGR